MAVKVSLLSWSTPRDGGSPITGYRVLVYEGPDLIETLQTRNPLLAVERSSTLYRTLLVQAINDQGLSAPLSVQLAPVSVEEPALIAPTLAAEAGDLQITVSLTEPGTGFATSQLSCVGPDGDILADRGVDLTYPYVVDNLYNGSEYTVSMLVTDADGRTAQSNILQVTPVRGAVEETDPTAPPSGNAGGAE